MSNEIIFSPERSWDSITESVKFPAEIDGKKIICKISIEALMDHFNCDVNNPLAAFDKNRPAIIEITEDFINGDLFEEDGSILVRNSDIL